MKTPLLILSADVLAEIPWQDDVDTEATAYAWVLLAHLRAETLTSLRKLAKWGYSLLIIVPNERNKRYFSSQFINLCKKEGIVYQAILTAEEFTAQRDTQQLTQGPSAFPFKFVVIYGDEGLTWLPPATFNENDKDNEDNDSLAKWAPLALKTPYYLFTNTDSAMTTKTVTNEQQATVRLISCGRWAELVRQLITRERIATVKRQTKETHVVVGVNLDGEGYSTVDTGLGFFNHMLENFAKHAQFDLYIWVKGDLHVDEHHTIEDTALTLGAALRQAWGAKQGMTRYAFSLPMDESHVTCLLDLSGRPYVVWNALFTRERVGDVPTELIRHFYESLALAGEFNLHLTLAGHNDHHQIEASFKALAKCFKQAVRRRGTAIPSTKGQL